MKTAQQEHMPKIPITVLATLCFIWAVTEARQLRKNNATLKRINAARTRVEVAAVLREWRQKVTLVMCQTRFKISKEISNDTYPPIKRSKECWFLYTIGNPDSFKCVLRIFVVITSPVLSLISTALLLFGKIESNPYFFIPWLFLTLKGLLFIQTDNLITILRDMSTKANYTFGFRMEDFKWMIFYFTIFMIDLVETFSFCEIFDLFLVLWNRHPKCSLETANLEAVKKDIADIMKSLSKCSFGSLSKISLGSTSDSEGTNDTNLKEPDSSVKFSIKDEDKIVDLHAPEESLSKGDATMKSDIRQKELKIGVEDELKCNNIFPIKPTSEGDAVSPFGYEKLLKSRDVIGSELKPRKSKLKALPPLEARQYSKNNADFEPRLLQKKTISEDVCS